MASKEISLLLSHIKAKRYIKSQYPVSYKDVCIIPLQCSDNKTIIGTAQRRMGLVMIIFNQNGIFDDVGILKRLIIDVYDVEKLFKQITRLQVLPFESTCIIPTHTGSFSHCLVIYLCVMKYILENEIDGNLLSLPLSSHIQELQTILLERKKLYMLHETNICYRVPACKLIRNVITDNPEYMLEAKTTFRNSPENYPSPYIRSIINTLLNKVILSKPLIQRYPKQIALVKINSSKHSFAMDRCFLEKPTLKVLNQNKYFLLNHERMSLTLILKLIFHCKKMIISWGSLAYYAMFLNQDQKCYVLVQEQYKNELKDEGICFHRGLFSNFVISKPLPNDLSNHTTYIESFLSTK